MVILQSGTCLSCSCSFFQRLLDDHISLSPFLIPPLCSFCTLFFAHMSLIFPITYILSNSPICSPVFHHRNLLTTVPPPILGLFISDKNELEILFFRIKFNLSSLQPRCPSTRASCVPRSSLNIAKSSALLRVSSTCLLFHIKSLNCSAKGSKPGQLNQWRNANFHTSESI